MAFRQQRLLEEGVYFGAEAQGVAGSGPEHADGLLAARVVKKGELCKVHDGKLLRSMPAFPFAVLAARNTHEAPSLI